MATELKAVPEEIVLKKDSGMREEVNLVNLLNVDNKNWQSIVCRRCDSLILFEDKVSIFQGAYMANLPVMTPGARNMTDTEEVRWWWHITDAFDFDSIGYAHPMIDGAKILVCGECEFGPIGLRNPDGTEFLLSVERVGYADKPTPKGHKPVPRKAKKIPRLRGWKTAEEKKKREKKKKTHRDSHHIVAWCSQSHSRVHKFHLTVRPDVAIKLDQTGLRRVDAGVIWSAS